MNITVFTLEYNFEASLHSASKVIKQNIEDCKF